MTPLPSSQLAPLLDVSARLGADPLLVQAGTGNTSIKLDGVLWIKASGKWLAHANHDDLMVPLNLSRALSCVRENRDVAAACEGCSPLRPSIETSMHAVLPHRVVIHVHSVNTIAWAVRRDGPREVGLRLDGIRWQWIPHVPSGRPLALEIERAVAAAPGTGVFILANHGLVICGDTPESAEALLRDVERRLAIRPRLAPEPDFRQLARVAAVTSSYVPDSTAFHALGTDRVSGRIVSRGKLYPCQAIFFGAEQPSRFMIVEDAGVMVHKEITKTERAMLAGLVEVVQRLEASAPIAYLTQREIDRAMSVEACSYRAQVEASSVPATENRATYAAERMPSRSELHAQCRLPAQQRRRS